MANFNFNISSSLFSVSLENNTETDCSSTYQYKVTSQSGNNISLKVGGVGQYPLNMYYTVLGVDTQFTNNSTISLTYGLDLYISFSIGNSGSPGVFHEVDIQVIDNTTAESYNQFDASVTRLNDNASCEAVGAPATTYDELIDTPGDKIGHSLKIIRVSADETKHEYVDFEVFEDDYESSGLEAIDEGNGIGWRLIGKDPTQSASIGSNAVDFGNFASNALQGASGAYSFNHGEDNIASVYGAVTIGAGLINSGYLSTVIGYLNSNSTYSSLVSGYNNSISGGNNRGYHFNSGRGNVMVNGFANTLLGSSLKLTNGVGVLVIGHANEEVTAVNNTTDADNPLFIIGNGTHSINAAGDWTTATTRSNALIVKHSGKFQIPSYGSGTVTGIAVKLISVDVDGNLIESNLPSEENVLGTTGELLTTTGATNVSLLVSSVFIRLTGDSVITFTDTPAVGNSIVRNYRIQSSTTQTFGVANSTAEFGEYVPDGTITQATVEVSNFINEGLKIAVFFSQPN